MGLAVPTAPRSLPVGSGEEAAAWGIWEVVCSGWTSEQG